MLKFRFLRIFAVLAFAVLLCGAAASAQVKAEMTANKIVLRDGKEVRESAEKAKPGETIEYVVTYTNKGSGAARNVLATLPIPVGTELLPATPAPADFTATVDSTTFGKLPLKKTVKGADGLPREVEVPMSEIRGIRWNLGELKPGEKRTVSARVRITPVEGTPAK